jgi:hypothetical protein
LCRYASDVAFDPSAPSLFALGCDDPFVRIFDIRHVGGGGFNFSPRASSPSVGAVYKLKNSVDP